MDEFVNDLDIVGRKPRRVHRVLEMTLFPVFTRSFRVDKVRAILFVQAFGKPKFIPCLIHNGTVISDSRCFGWLAILERVWPQERKPCMRREVAQIDFAVRKLWRTAGAGP